MAHRAERVAARAMLHELDSATALLDLGQFVFDCDRLFVGHIDSFENQKTPRPSSGREVCSRGPTCVRRLVRGGALVCRANGRRPDRFTDRSRVVPIRIDRRASSRGPDSLVIAGMDRCVPLDASSGCGGRHWTRTSDLLHVKYRRPYIVPASVAKRQMRGCYDGHSPARGSWPTPGPPSYAPVGPDRLAAWGERGIEGPGPEPGPPGV